MLVVEDDDRSVMLTITLHYIKEGGHTMKNSEGHRNSNVRRC